MKLKIIKNGQEEYIHVGFWSFAKCYFISQIIISTIYLFIISVLAYFGVLSPAT